MIDDMHVRLSRLEHRVNSIVRFGTIKSLDLNTNRVVVDMGDKLETSDLPYYVPSSGNAWVYFVPKVGDQVMILSKNGDIATAVVMPSIYSNAVQGIEDEWNLKFADGNIHYKEGTLIIEATSEITVKSEKVFIDSEDIILSGDDGGGIITENCIDSFTGQKYESFSSKIVGAK